MRHAVLTLAAGLAIGSLCSPAVADILYLTDGTSLVGEIRPVNEPGRNGYIVIDAEGNEIFVPETRVQRLVLGRDKPASRPSDGRGQTRLDSLRRSVSNVSDLRVIISKYEAFLRQNEVGPIADEARKELAEWRDRLERGLVKLGSEWVTPEERDRRLAASLGRVNEARLTVKEGDAQAARELAEQLTADAATAAGGHYLLGVMALRDDNLAEARKQFEAVRNLEPTHPPTLVNLAVIQTRLNRPERAMWFLAEAMKETSANEEVLNNAMEALQLLPSGARNEPNARRAAKLFEQQDRELRARKAEQGLYRWGSRWVDQAEYDRLEAIQEEIDAAVAELRAEYDAIGREIERIDDRIQANDAYMRRLASQSYARDAEGNLVQLPLPPAYYEAQRENEQLAAERERLQVARRRLDQQAAQERAKLPTPPFSGELTPIGEDGVPVTLPPASSAEPSPATEPAADEPAE